MHLNELDYIILLLLFISGVIGVLRGLIKEILQLANLFLSIFAAIFLRKYVTFVFNFIGSEFIKELISGILIFILVFIIGSIVIYLIYQTIKIQGFGKFIDKILGLQFGIARGVLLLMISIMTVENNNNFTNTDWWKHSFLLVKVQKISITFTKAIPISWKEKMEQLKE